MKNKELKDIIKEKQPKPMKNKELKVSNKQKKLTDIYEIIKYMKKEIHKAFGNLEEGQEYDPHMVIGFDGETPQNHKLWKLLYDFHMGDVIPLDYKIKHFRQLLDKIVYTRGTRDLQNHPHNNGGYQTQIPYTFIEKSGKKHIFSRGLKEDTTVDYTIYVNQSNIVLKQHSLQIKVYNSDEDWHPSFKSMSVTPTNLKGKLLKVYDQGF